MKRVLLWCAAPGLHLGEPLVGRDGKPVAGRGTALGAPQLRALLVMGFETAVVVEDDAVADWEEARDPAGALEALHHRFGKDASDPILAALKAALRRHLEAPA